MINDNLLEITNTFLARRTKVQRPIIVTLTSASALALHCKVLIKVFLCYGQGSVRQAILYRDMSFVNSYSDFGNRWIRKRYFCHMLFNSF